MSYDFSTPPGAGNDPFGGGGGAVGVLGALGAANPFASPGLGAIGALTGLTSPATSSSATAFGDDKKVIVTGGTGVNFGGQLLPYTGAQGNGGFGSTVSRFVNDTGKSAAALVGAEPSSAPLIGLALLGLGGVFAFKYLRK